MKNDLTKKELTRFWAKVNKNGPVPEHLPELGPCWLWTGARTHDHGDRFRYGRFSFRKRIVGSHRISLIIATGELSDTLCACHKCDTPSCVNPDHIFAGTRVNNTMDMVSKGRQRGVPSGMTWAQLHPENVIRGSAHPNSKLTEADVVEIRRRYAAGGIKQQTLADEFGVTQILISKIVCRYHWKHVP